MTSQSNNQAYNVKACNVHYLIQLQGGLRCTVDILKKMNSIIVILLICKSGLGSS